MMPSEQQAGVVRCKMVESAEVVREASWSKVCATHGIARHAKRLRELREVLQMLRVCLGARIHAIRDRAAQRLSA